MKIIRVEIIPQGGGGYLVKLIGPKPERTEQNKYPDEPVIRFAFTNLIDLWAVLFRKLSDANLKKDDDDGQSESD